MPRNESFLDENAQCETYTRREEYRRRERSIRGKETVYTLANPINMGNIKSPLYKMLPGNLPIVSS